MTRQKLGFGLDPVYLPPDHGWPLTYWTLRWDGDREAWIATQRQTAPEYPPQLFQPDGTEEATGEELVLTTASCAQHAARLVHIQEPGAPCYFWWRGDLLCTG